MISIGGGLFSQQSALNEAATRMRAAAGRRSAGATRDAQAANLAALMAAEADAAESGLRRFEEVMARATEAQGPEVDAAAIGEALATAWAALRTAAGSSIPEVAENQRREVGAANSESDDAAGSGGA